MPRKKNTTVTEALTVLIGALIEERTELYDNLKKTATTIDFNTGTITATANKKSQAQKYAGRYKVITNLLQQAYDMERKYTPSEFIVETE